MVVQNYPSCLMVQLEVVLQNSGSSGRSQEGEQSPQVYSSSVLLEFISR